MLDTYWAELSVPIKHGPRVIALLKHRGFLGKEEELGDYANAENTLAAFEGDQVKCADFGIETTLVREGISFDKLYGPSIGKVEFYEMYRPASVQCAEVHEHHSLDAWAVARELVLRLQPYASGDTARHLDGLHARFNQPKLGADNSSFSQVKPGVANSSFNLMKLETVPATEEDI